MGAIIVGEVRGNSKKECAGGTQRMQWIQGQIVDTQWASLVAQLVKNPSAMQESWVRSLGWADTLEKGTATHSSILAWRIPWTV